MFLPASPSQGGELLISATIEAGPQRTSAASENAVCEQMLCSPVSSHLWAFRRSREHSTGTHSWLLGRGRGSSKVRTVSTSNRLQGQSIDLAGAPKQGPWLVCAPNSGPGTGSTVERRCTGLADLSLLSCFLLGWFGLCST